jgi:hypothetical protein
VVSDGKQPGGEFSVDADACPGVYQLQEEILESVLGRFQITQHSGNSGGRALKYRA